MWRRSSIYLVNALDFVVLLHRGCTFRTRTSWGVKHLSYVFLCQTITRYQMCILLSASRDVHFDKRMICFCLLWKAHQRQHHKEKHHPKNTVLLCDFKSSLYIILWYAFMNWVNSISQTNLIILLSKSTSWLSVNRKTYHCHLECVKRSSSWKHLRKFTYWFAFWKLCPFFLAVRM